MLYLAPKEWSENAVPAFISAILSSALLVHSTDYLGKIRALGFGVQVGGHQAERSINNIFPGIEDNMCKATTSSST